MTYARPILPIRCLIDPAGLWPEPTPADLLPPDLPLVECVGPALAVCQWPDGCRQLVTVISEDALLGEAYVRYWVRAGIRAEALEHVVPSDWLTTRQ